jgi:hypothetical protein
VQETMNGKSSKHEVLFKGFVSLNL